LINFRQIPLGNPLITFRQIPLVDWRGPVPVSYGHDFGSGTRVLGSGVRNSWVQGLEFQVSGFGIRDSSFGFWVPGFGHRFAGSRLSCHVFRVLSSAFHTNRVAD